MPAHVLTTKLYRPRPRADLVTRPRLRARLDSATAAKLILVSAPAGFGKTTVLIEWLAEWPAAAEGDRSVAWLSLDRGDDDQVAFWTSVIAAIRAVAPDVGAAAAAFLDQPGPTPIRQVLTTLLNDLDQDGEELVLVLDDYHLVETREVQDAMAFLIDHLPPRLRLVIAGRADPAMPLARLRAGGDLVEIRAADLRFTPAEAATYLTGVMGLPLSGADVARLEERTEGWIAALQLAALSMQGREELSRFIDGFAGDDRYVVDYLAEEVLQRQPREVRDFLLHTCFLSRMNGPLCDAVTEGTGGRARLEALERGNLFVVPLDDRRRWYRYHHLFADVLRAQLLDSSPELVQTLHRRASDWYATNGDASMAIDHALSAGAFDRAADLLETSMGAIRRDRQEGAMRAWLEQLPEEVLAVRPVLSNAWAAALLGTGQVAGVERHLADAERWLDPARTPGDESGPSEMVVADAGEFRRLPAAVAIHRAGLTLLAGDLPGTVGHATRALDLLDRTPDLHEVDRHLGRGAAEALLGLASWWGGDLGTARRAYLGSLEAMRRAGHLSDVFGVSLALADLQLTQGHLRDAARTYEQALEFASGPGQPVLRGTADMYVGLSGIHWERDDLTGARRFLDLSDGLGEHLGLPQNRYRSRMAAARILEAEGDLEGAEALLEQAERAYAGDFSPDVRPVAVARARIWIKQGRVREALDLLASRGVSAGDEPGYRREFEHVTLLRALLALPGTAQLDEALTLSGRLLAEAEAGSRLSVVVEILVLQARTHRRRGDLPAAATALARARRIGQPEGYVRVFLDEATEPAGQPGATTAGPVEALSRREVDVLRLLGSELGGPEIARELVLSLNTVRTHTKNIYAKLGVTNRRAAVRRATELNLLPPHRG